VTRPRTPLRHGWLGSTIRWSPSRMPRSTRLPPDTRRAYRPGAASWASTSRTSRVSSLGSNPWNAVILPAAMLPTMGSRCGGVVGSGQNRSPCAPRSPVRRRQPAYFPPVPGLTSRFWGRQVPWEVGSPAAVQGRSDRASRVTGDPGVALPIVVVEEAQVLEQPAVLEDCCPAEASQLATSSIVGDPPCSASRTRNAAKTRRQVVDS
jgi:hypothetical protein